MNRGDASRVLSLCANLAWCLAVWAEELPHEDLPQRRQPSAAAAQSGQVLIFNNGRTVKGRISRSPNGYVVEHAAGRLVVPYDETRIVGDSLPDAFRRLRESFVNPTSATHYQLAQWAFAHQMVNDARAELVQALDRDPDHEGARDLLDRIDQQIAAERKKAAAPKTTATRRMVGEFELPEIESLAGLSRETASQYTTRIQPLLLNKCGNAGCHGSKSETEFKLEMIRGTGSGHRMHSERNLAAVLKQMNLNAPQHSPLITIPSRSHGGLNKAIFFGPAGEKQLQMLKDWVRIAAKETNADAQVAGQRPSVMPFQPKFPPGSALQAAKDDEPMPEPGMRSPQASVSDLSKSKTQSPPVADEDHIDPFDPQVFNQKYHRPPVDPASRKKKR